MKDDRVRLCVIVAIVAVTALFVSVANAAPILIRFSHVVGENTPKGTGEKVFKELVEKRLSGKVVVEIYPRSQKYTDALRVGVVDGYENTWSNVLSKGLHLLRPYFTEVGHSYLGYMVVTSNSFWNSLPADIQTELQAIMEEVTVVVNNLAKEKEIRIKRKSRKRPVFKS